VSPERLQEQQAQYSEAAALHDSPEEARRAAISFSPEGVEGSEDRSGRFPVKKTAFTDVSNCTVSGEML
jgi:hypothetical protein